MSEPGEQRLPDGHTGAREQERGQGAGRRITGDGGTRRSLAGGLLRAGLIAFGAALAWAVLRGVLELGPTALAVAIVGGWGIGAVLREARAPAIMAALVALGAWLLGLVLSWLLAMALLPGSSRTLLERIEGTPFLDWMAPQLGIVEVAGLLVFVIAAAWTARPAAHRTT
jgi:hypothetical protein